MGVPRRREELAIQLRFGGELQVHDDGGPVEARDLDRLRAAVHAREVDVNLVGAELQAGERVIAVGISGGVDDRSVPPSLPIGQPARLEGGFSQQQLTTLAILPVAGLPVHQLGTGGKGAVSPQ